MRAAVVAALLVTGACASPPPAGRTEHIVRRGENLYRLSRYYGVSVEAIRAANDIRDVRELQIGQRLVIPGTSEPTASKSLAVALPRTSPPSARADGRAQALRESGIAFAWPVRGRLSSKFGPRRGGRHDGIDIPAQRGTPVRAAEAGRVIESGRLGDYGQVVIVKHVGSYSTVYAHNSRNRVHKGDFVEKGQVIAEVGATGNASGPHVHFEVRRNRHPEDPLAYLP